jgi:Uma2 family endonuclease
MEGIDLVGGILFMASQQPDRRYSLAEYLELEKNSQEKYEWFNGELFLMSGASPEHNFIVINVGGELREQLKQTRVSGSDLRVKVPAALPYRYPDVTVVCENPQ